MSYWSFKDLRRSLCHTCISATCVTKVWTRPCLCPLRGPETPGWETLLQLVQFSACVYGWMLSVKNALVHIHNATLNDSSDGSNSHIYCTALDVMPLKDVVSATCILVFILQTQFCISRRDLVVKLLGWFGGSLVLHSRKHQACFPLLSHYTFARQSHPSPLAALVSFFK